MSRGIQSNKLQLEFALPLEIQNRIGYTLLSRNPPDKEERFVPNIKSVKKDVIKSRKNHLRNISAKSALKTFVKKARIAIDTPSTEVAETTEAIRLACKSIDKTAERGIIHRNQASRRKSRLMKRANKAVAHAAA